MAIAQKNGYGALHSLAQRDLEILSQEIASKTGTLISISTLKRLFKGDFSRIPQVATLNAISMYLGYKHWQDYRASTNIQGLSPTVQDTPQRPVYPKKKFPRALAYSAILSLLVLVVLISRSSLNDPTASFETARFSVKKITKNDIPNTVVFSYNIDDVEADSFFIQQSWDVNRRVRIYKKNYTLTDIYYEPGYHTAKLIANDIVIKTLDVSIPTDRWFLYAKPQLVSSTQTYIHTNKHTHDGLLGIDDATLKMNKINPEVKNTYFYTYFPSKMNVHSDNFVYTARIRAVETKKTPCPYVMLEVFCQKNFMYFINTPLGCTSESKMQFGDLILDGKTRDLSALGLDVSTWWDVRLEISNKNVTIYLNGRKVFTDKYSISAGLVTGIGFISNGLCEIELLELKGRDGAVFYKNDFEEAENVELN